MIFGKSATFVFVTNPESIKRRGVVAIPVVRVGGGEAEVLVLPPIKKENAGKAERCPLIDGEELRPLSGYEFPGGKVEEGETESMALRREISEEAKVSLSGDVEKLTRLLQLPIDQYRDGVSVSFCVNVFAWNPTREEIEEMMLGGAKEAYFDSSSGKLFDLDTNEELPMRPAHEAIVRYVGGMIGFLKWLVEAFPVLQSEGGV